MKPVDQTKFYVPGVSHGNCQQAATASLLGLPLEDVPDFFADGEAQFWPSFWKYIASRGMAIVEMSGERHYDCYHLAYGPAPRGCDHAVVYRSGKLAHDPHPSRAGLISVSTSVLIVPQDWGDWRHLLS